MSKRKLTIWTSDATTVEELDREARALWERICEAIKGQPSGFVAVCMLNMLIGELPEEVAIRSAFAMASTQGKTAVYEAMLKAQRRIRGEAVVEDVIDAALQDAAKTNAEQKVG